MTSKERESIDQKTQVKNQEARVDGADLNLQASRERAGPIVDTRMGMDSTGPQLDTMLHGPFMYSRLVGFNFLIISLKGS